MLRINYPPIASNRIAWIAVIGCFAVLTTAVVQSNAVEYRMYYNGGAGATLTKDCNATCHHYDSLTEYNACYRSCQDNPKPYSSRKKFRDPHRSTRKYYPSPPRNLTVSLSVHVEGYYKEIKAQIKWDAQPDERQGFTLTVIAKGLECQEKFAGYHVLNIPGTARARVIPASVNQVELVIDHGCTYSVEMHSKPYPYRQAEYSASLIFTVPDCIDGYCDCNDQPPLPAPKDVSVVTYPAHSGEYNAKIRWSYRFLPIQTDTTVNFYLSVASLNKAFLLFSPQFQRKIFTNYIPYEAPILGYKNRTQYEVSWSGLKLGDEHKLRIFAVSPQICSSEDAVEIFIVEDAIDKSTELSGINKATTIITTTTTTAQINATTHPSTNDNNPHLSSFTPESNYSVTPNNRVIGTTNRGNSSSNKLATKHPRLKPGTDRTASSMTSSPTKKVENASLVPPMLPGIGLDPESDNEPSVISGKSTISHHDYLWIFLPIIFLLSLVIVAFGICRLYTLRCEKLKQKKIYLEQMSGMPWSVSRSVNVPVSDDTMETNILYREKEIVDAIARGLVDEFEVAYERITLGRVIGQGAFGLVFLGRAEAIGGMSGNVAVAVKQLKADAAESERQEFLSEIGMMKRVGSHRNIVNMLGCCTMVTPHCMIMEYVPHGDLLHYLRNIRKEYEQQNAYQESSNISTLPYSSYRKHKANIEEPQYQNMNLSAVGYLTNESTSDCQCGMCEVMGDIPFADAEAHGFCDHLDYSLDPVELQSFALQVGKGMEHLESLGITHRDLAARNILVGRGKVLKISDFGLSRVGIYVKTTSGRIPLRWLSIEAIREHIYTSKSDRWAYGIVLWEICTLGGFPYPTISDKALLRHLNDGNRLDKPSSCSDSIYNLMLQCWSHNPDERPAFSAICDFLSALNNENSPYVEFKPNELLPPEGYCNIMTNSMSISRSMSD